MKITEIFDQDSSASMDLTNNPGRFRCSSRLRSRNSLEPNKGGRHGSKCYEKDCCSSSGVGKTPQNGKKRHPKPETSSQKRNKKSKTAYGLEEEEDDDESLGTTMSNTNSTGSSSTTNSARGKSIRAKVAKTSEEGRSKNNLAHSTAMTTQTEENGFIRFIAHLVESEWNDPKLMEMIQKNFAGFSDANPELFIKLFLLIFLNNCADFKEGKDENENGNKFEELMKLGQKAKKMLVEIEEKMVASKFRELSSKVESTLCFIFSADVEQVNEHPLLKNRVQFAKSIQKALETNKK